MEGKANATRLLIDSSGTVEIEMIILLIILCVIQGVNVFKEKYYI